MKTHALTWLLCTSLAVGLASCSFSRFTSTGGIVSPGNRSQPAAPVVFPVSIGGQTVIPAYAWCARIIEPVTLDATIKVPTGERVTIDLYASEVAGRSSSKNVRATYSLKEGGARKLNDVSQGIAPTPGTYLAEIVRVKSGTQVRALFTVAPKSISTRPAAVSLSDL